VSGLAAGRLGVSRYVGRPVPNHRDCHPVELQGTRLRLGSTWLIEGDEQLSSMLVVQRCR
jgi:hypothetical protein